MLIVISELTIEEERDTDSRDVAERRNWAGK
jgi:hypothetical protein